MQVRSGIASHHRPSTRYQASEGRTSGRSTRTQRPREGASRWRSGLTQTGLELGDLGWQWSLCLIRIAPSPGRSAPYWLVRVVGARSGPSDSNGVKESMTKCPMYPKQSRDPIVRPSNKPNRVTLSPDTYTYTHQRAARKTTVHSS